MATRKYELEGPTRAKWTLSQVGQLLGFDEDRARDTVRRLIDQGFLPRPRGRGDHLYYTGLDVAVILDYYGRWGPTAQDGVIPPKPTKSRENPPKAESEE